MMKPFPALLACAAATLLAGSALAQPTAEDREAELAEVLEGWTEAGPPERCLHVRRARIVRIVNRTAVVYRFGGALYVNRPSAGAEHLDRRDSIVTRRGGVQLCEGEMMELTDPYSGIVRLATAGPFIPYRRAD